MTPIAIINSLLRLDGTTGEPPSPFERPNHHMNFFVLELGQHESVAGFCAHVSENLFRHEESLRRLRGTGARATLFVECVASLKVLRLDTPFLAALCQAEIALEITS